MSVDPGTTPGDFQRNINVSPDPTALNTEKDPGQTAMVSRGAGKGERLNVSEDVIERSAGGTGGNPNIGDTESGQPLLQKPKYDRFSSFVGGSSPQVAVEGEVDVQKEGKVAVEEDSTIQEFVGQSQVEKDQGKKGPQNGFERAASHMFSPDSKGTITNAVFDAINDLEADLDGEIDPQLKAALAAVMDESPETDDIGGFNALGGVWAHLAQQTGAEIPPRGGVDERISGTTPRAFRSASFSPDDAELNPPSDRKLTPEEIKDKKAELFGTMEEFLEMSSDPNVVFTGSYLKVLARLLALVAELKGELTSDDAKKIQEMTETEKKNIESEAKHTEKKIQKAMDNLRKVWKARRASNIMKWVMLAVVVVVSVVAAAFTGGASIMGVIAIATAVLMTTMTAMEAAGVDPMQKAFGQNAWIAKIVLAVVITAVTLGAGAGASAAAAANASKAAATAGTAAASAGSAGAQATAQGTAQAAKSAAIASQVGKEASAQALKTGLQTIVPMTVGMALPGAIMKAMEAAVGDNEDGAIAAAIITMILMILLALLASGAGNAVANTATKGAATSGVNASASAIDDAAGAAAKSAAKGAAAAGDDAARVGAAMGDDMAAAGAGAADDTLKGLSEASDDLIRELGKAKTTMQKLKVMLSDHGPHFDIVAQQARQAGKAATAMAVVSAGVGAGQGIYQGVQDVKRAQDEVKRAESEEENAVLDGLIQILKALRGDLGKTKEAFIDDMQDYQNMVSSMSETVAKAVSQASQFTSAAHNT